MFFGFIQECGRVIEGISGGTLKMVVLRPGPVIQAFDMAVAVTKNTPSPGFGVPSSWHEKNSAPSLFVTGGLGSILAGIATSIETAVVGARSAVLQVVAYRRLTWTEFREAVNLTARTTAMMACLFVGS